MRKDPLYYEGYVAGYRDGVKDAFSGKAEGWQLSDIGRLPIQAMALSSRARNCLILIFNENLSRKALKVFI